MSQPLILSGFERAPRFATLAGTAVFIALMLFPMLALLPEGYPLAISTYTLTLVGKILCYAVVAIALDLVWGYAGLLSLGHGLFFALGGYAMGMYLMREAAGQGLPPFMSFLSWNQLPWFWTGTEYFAWTLCLIILAPGLLAFIFGYFSFRSKIKGVYFSIMTQALTYAAMLLFFRNETGFGGNNGFTGFTTLLGFSVTATRTRVGLFMATVLLLAASLVIGFALARSKFGRVLTAIRDAENRLVFCGYDPKGFKLFVWTLSAILCGLAGALYLRFAPRGGLAVGVSERLFGVRNAYYRYKRRRAARKFQVYMGKQGRSVKFDSDGRYIDPDKKKDPTDKRWMN